jgi:hypothetical protein
MTAANVVDNTSDGEVEDLEGLRELRAGRNSRLDQQTIKSASACLGRGVSTVFIARSRLAAQSGPSFPTPHPIEHEHWRPR